MRYFVLLIFGGSLMSHIVLDGSGRLSDALVRSLQDKHCHDVEMRVVAGAAADLLADPNVDLCLVTEEAADRFSAIAYVRSGRNIENIPIRISCSGRTDEQIIEACVEHIARALRQYSPVIGKYWRKNG
jgi:hypothetical protein